MLSGSTHLELYLTLRGSPQPAFPLAITTWHMTKLVSRRSSNNIDEWCGWDYCLPPHSVPDSRVSHATPRRLDVPGKSWFFHTCRATSHDRVPIAIASDISILDIGFPALGFQGCFHVQLPRNSPQKNAGYGAHGPMPLRFCGYVGYPDIETRGRVFRVIFRMYRTFSVSLGFYNPSRIFGKTTPPMSMTNVYL